MVRPGMFVHRAVTYPGEQGLTCVHMTTRVCGLIPTISSVPTLQWLAEDPTLSPASGCRSLATTHQFTLAAIPPVLVPFLIAVAEY